MFVPAGCRICKINQNKFSVYSLVDPDVKSWAMFLKNINHSFLFFRPFEIVLHHIEKFKGIHTN